MLQQSIHYQTLKQDPQATSAQQQNVTACLSRVNDQRLLDLLASHPIDTLEFTTNVEDPNAYGALLGGSNHIQVHLNPLSLPHGRPHSQRVVATCEYGGTAPEIMQIALYHEIGHFLDRYVFCRSEVAPIIALLNNQPPSVSDRGQALRAEYFPETLVAVTLFPQLRQYDPTGFDAVDQMLTDVVHRVRTKAPCP